MIINNINVLDNNKTFQNAVKILWSHNIFILLTTVFYYLLTTILSFIDRIIYMPLFLYCLIFRKKYEEKEKFNNKFLTQIKVNTFRNLSGLAIFLLFFICKFIYHSFIITCWIFKNIITPLFKALFMIWAVLRFTGGSKQIDNTIKQKLGL